MDLLSNPCCECTRYSNYLKRFLSKIEKPIIKGNISQAFLSSPKVQSRKWKFILLQIKWLKSRRILAVQQRRLWMNQNSIIAHKSASGSNSTLVEGAFFRAPAPTYIIIALLGVWVHVHFSIKAAGRNGAQITRAVVITADMEIMRRLGVVVSGGATAAQKRLSLINNDHWELWRCHFQFVRSQIPFAAARKSRDSCMRT